MAGGGAHAEAVDEMASAPVGQFGGGTNVEASDDVATPSGRNNDDNGLSSTDADSAGQCGTLARAQTRASQAGQGIYC